MSKDGQIREDYLLEPISGKAFPVYQGEIYRIIQEVGKTCVDINVWNLHDYREFMDQSIMRRQGFRLEKGHFLISNSPRNRLLMQLIEKSPVNIFNNLGHRCNGAMIEARWGVYPHSSCQDSLAEAIGEYGLTPDNVHAVPCPWMPVHWDDRGIFSVGSNRNVPKGDYMDLLALEDVLMASCICGTTDYTDLGGYWPQPVRLQIFERSRETERMMEDVRQKHPPLRGQKTPKDYRVKRGKDEDFAIKHDPSYEPQFINFPQKYERVQLDLPEEDYEQVQRMVERGFRDDNEDAIRSAVMEWYLHNRTEPNPLGRAIGFDVKHN